VRLLTRSGGAARRVVSARRDRETYRLKIGAEPRSSDSTHPSAPLMRVMRVQEPSCEGPRDHRGQLDAGFVLRAHVRRHPAGQQLLSSFGIHPVRRATCRASSLISFRGSAQKESLIRARGSGVLRPGRWLFVSPSLKGPRDGTFVEGMHQVFYSSAALAPFSDTQLTELLAVARVNNGRLGVTGMLLYDDGSFLQVLEGAESVVESLYAKIGRDKRHHRVVALLRRSVDNRYFDQWQMGFASMKTVPTSMPGYSDYLRLRGNPIESGNVAAVLLAAFRDGRFRSYVQI